MNDGPIPVAAHLLQDWIWQRIGPLPPFKRSRTVRSSGRARFHKRVLDELCAMTRVPGPLLMMAERERIRRTEAERAAQTASRTALHNPYRIWVKGAEYGTDWSSRRDVP